MVAPTATYPVQQYLPTAPDALRPVWTKLCTLIPQILHGVVRCLLAVRLLLVTAIHIGRKQQQAADIVTPLVDILRAWTINLVLVEVIGPDALNIARILALAIDVVEEVGLAGYLPLAQALQAGAPFPQPRTPEAKPLRRPSTLVIMTSIATIRHT